MARVQQFDFDDSQVKQLQISNAPLEEFANFFLNTRAWHDDLDAVHLRVRKLRRQIADEKIAIAAKRAAKAAGQAGSEATT